MRKLIFVNLLFAALAISCFMTAAQAQHYRHGAGYGRGWDTWMMEDWPELPATLPAPKNAEWLQKLREVLANERHSLVRYESDLNKFDAPMPYLMVIAQEKNHIYWLERLFAAYGLSAEGKTKSITEPGSLAQAFEAAIKMESDLLARYEWLVKNTGDRVSAQALNAILYQTRTHLAMFEHARNAGAGYWFGMGPGFHRGWRGFGHGGILVWALFIIILAALIYFVFNSVKSKHGPGSSGETPLEILKKRYAKGEVTKEEFKRIRSDLK
jgi:uncharacterized membrane protein